MALKVEANHPALPEGTELDIGVAAVPNGGSVIVSSQDAALYEKQHGTTIQEAFKNSDIFTVTSKGVAEPEDTSMDSYIPLDPVFNPEGKLTAEQGDKLDEAKGNLVEEEAEGGEKA